jgi:restriction system protein
LTIPDFQTLMRPVLAYLADDDLHRSRSVKDAMADEFKLTPEEREELLPSGRQRVIDNRVGWALTYLSQAGLVDRPQRGLVRITDAGHQVLSNHAARVDMKVLEQFPAYIEFRDRTRQPKPEAPSASSATLPEVSSPQDLIERAVTESRAVLEAELLKRALTLSPTGFEDFVMALLSAMGYGEQGSLERTSATGDAGVDGIISQDPLGLDRIYMQAKRYALDRVIDRPKIHEFAGALLGKQGDRGVYITTSSFTKGARDEAERLNARIELIDGRRLARLLVDYGVGVQPESVVTLHRIDEDFFESL